MMHKATFVAGVAVGYVLGARAGRERYETIKRAADQLRSSPQVQEAASRLSQQATGLASQAGHVVTERVGERLPFGSHHTEDASGYTMPNGRQAR